MSVALNSKIDKRSSSASAGSHGSELTARDEAGVPVTQISCEVKSLGGSNAGESVASMVGLSLRSLDGAIGSDLRVGAVAGAISRTLSDGRAKPCSLWPCGALGKGSNPSKIKSPRISAV